MKEKIVEVSKTNPKSEVKIEPRVVKELREKGYIIPKEDKIDPSDRSPI